MTDAIDVSDLVKKFEAIAKDSLPKAQAYAVNRAAEYARDALSAEIPRAFDRPSPFTMRAVMLSTYANADRPYRDVFLRDEAAKGRPPVKYLFPQTDSGPRPLKRAEYALRKVGAIGPSDWMVPARSAEKNAFGNISQGTIAKIMSQAKAYTTAGASKNETAASRNRNPNKSRFAYIRAGRGVKPGIYERIGPTFSKRNRAALMSLGVDDLKTARKKLKQLQKVGPIRGPQVIEDREILARGLRPVFVLTTSQPRYSPVRWPFRKHARDAFTSEFAQQFQLQFDLRTSRFTDRGQVLRIGKR